MAATSLPLNRRQTRPAAPATAMIQRFALLLSEVFKDTRAMERAAEKRYPHLSFDS